MSWELILTIAVGAGAPIGCLAFFYLKTRKMAQHADKVLRSYGL